MTWPYVIGKDSPDSKNNNIWGDDQKPEGSGTTSWLGKSKQSMLNFNCQFDHTDNSAVLCKPDIL